MYAKSMLSRFQYVARWPLWKLSERDGIRLSNPAIRCLCKKLPDAPDDRHLKKEKKDFEDLAVNVGGYKPFRDQDAPVIFDVEEERFLKQEQMAHIEEADEFEGLLLERGERGVLAVEELVNILHSQKAKDIVVVSIPSSFKYVDEMVFVTGKSHRHIYAIAEFVHRAFKRKRVESDRIPRIEGSKTSDWIALDLGNIALHIFSHNTRKLYDLETLWAVGPEYDTLLNLPEDTATESMKSYILYLDDLQPAVPNMKSE